MFMCYGPNTNIGHGGSIIYHTELQVRYIMQMVGRMLKDGVSTVECKQEVYEAYCEHTDRTLEKLVWADAGCTSWYKTASGKVVNNSPWKFQDYFAMTRDADIDRDYDLSTTAKARL
jgi:4-hydroxyacetophenone monooxygenase